MGIFKRKSDKLNDLFLKFFNNNGEDFAKHQMREQADNTYRIRLLERNENRRERLSFLEHKQEITTLSEEEYKEIIYLKWFFESYLTLEDEPK